MRVRHVEQALVGLAALEPMHRAPLEHARTDVERLRHLLWNGKHGEACRALDRIVSWLESVREITELFVSDATTKAALA